MAFQISPGINVSEIDLTTIIPAVGTTVGAIAGPFRWGPVDQRVLIDSELALVAQFGRPDNNCDKTWFTAANFLAYANALQTVRVVGAGAKNATADGAGLLIKNEDVYLNQYASGEGAAGMWAAKFPGDVGNSITVSMADAHSFGTWAFKQIFDSAPGTSQFVQLGGGSNDELHVVVVDKDGFWTGTKGAILEKYAYVSKCVTAKGEDGGTIYYAEVLNRKSKFVWWMDFPTNTELGSTTVNWGDSVDPQTLDYDTMALKLTMGSVTGTEPVVGELVESKATVTFDTAPTTAASGLVATIGTDADAGKVMSIAVGAGGSGYTGVPTVTITGDGTGATATATVVNGVVTGILVGAPGSGYTNATVALTMPGTGAAATATVVAGVITAITVNSHGTGYVGAPKVVIAGPGTGATATAVLGTGGTATQVSTVTVNAGGTGYSPVSAKLVAVATPVWTVAPVVGTITTSMVLKGKVGGGTASVSSIAGVGPLTSDLAGGVDDNANVTDADKINGFDLFSSGEEVDVSLVLGADASPVVAEHIISNVVEARKDAVAFLSPRYADVVDNAGNEVTDIIEFRDMLPTTSYSVLDCNWKYQFDKYNDLMRWIPLNGDVAGLCVRTDNVRDPWWSPAGYNRGQIKNVIRLAWNPRKAFRDELYKNGINPVITEAGQGSLLFGDKTMLTKPSAFDRINVRRLFIVLEKAISTAAKYTLFEFNDQFTRAQFRSIVEPFLRDVQGRRGIYDYKVVCDETNNTPEVIDGNRFVGDIYIKPARSINFIQLNFVAVRTGVAFEEVVGKF